MPSRRRTAASKVLFSSVPATIGRLNASLSRGAAAALNMQYAGSGGNGGAGGAAGGSYEPRKSPLHVHASGEGDGDGEGGGGGGWLVYTADAADARGAV